MLLQICIIFWSEKRQKLPWKNKFWNTKYYNTSASNDSNKYTKNACYTFFSNMLHYNKIGFRTSFDNYSSCNVLQAQWLFTLRDLHDLRSYMSARLFYPPLSICAFIIFPKLADGDYIMFRDKSKAEDGFILSLRPIKYWTCARSPDHRHPSASYSRLQLLWLPNNHS